MRKPPRTPTERLEDAFADLSAADQELVLRMLNSLHRQKLRAEAEKPAPTNGQQKLVEDQP